MVIARLGEGAANDGLAMDALDQIYVAADGQGKIWRLVPPAWAVTLIVERLPRVAGPAFGKGEFDQGAIHATSTRTGSSGK